jgi:thiol-disulfide isomerase/thioredoxin
VSSKTSTSSSSNVLLIVGTVAVLLAAAAFAVLGGSDDSDFDLDAIADPTIESTGTTAVEGQPAPEVSAPSLLGSGEEVIPVDGQGTMIVFLAHWCPACNNEVPVVVDWLEDDPLPEGVAVRTVATAIDPNANHYPPDTWLERRDWTAPTLIDTDGSIGQAYGIEGYPMWVFVDAEGTIVARGGAQTAEQLDQVAAALAPAG